jgi:antitoxin YefM
MEIMTRILVYHNGGQNMETLSLSEAKMKLSSLVDRVNNLDEEIIITKNGKPAAVMVSPDEYEGWKETILINSDPDFIKEIKKGLKALKDKKARLYTLDELFDE